MSLLRLAIRLTAVRIALIVHTLLAIALCFVPLFDVLGFERAFATGLISAPIAAAVAISLLRTAEREPAWGVEQTGAVGVALFLLFLVPPALAGLLVELVQEPCSPGQGAGFLLLCAGTASLYGGALGLVAASLPRLVRPGWWVALVLVGSLLLSFWRLYDQPQIFAFSMPFGYWPGSLYDEEVEITGAVWAHRGLTVLVAATLFSLVRALYDPKRRGKRAVAQRGALSWAMASGLAAVVLQLQGETLGFDQDRETIEEALSKHVVLDELELWIDPSIEKRTLQQLIEDHQLRYRQLAEFFGVAPKRRLVSYVYRDTDQKRTLMGAANTQLSRPWAGEIHIDGFETPHRVLKHELAHLFAAELAGGPFKVPALGGLLINLGIVEGTAVAADWPARVLTTHQWAQAMRVLGLAPDLRKALYPTGFWSQSSVRAYTAAGSFLRWLIETRGIDRFKVLYRSNDFEESYGTGLDALVTEWETFLDGLGIAPEERVLAEHRFRQPSIFQRVCPHTTAHLAEEGFQSLMHGDLERATERFERVLEYDPGRADVLLSLAKAHGERSEIERGRTFARRALDTEGMTERGKADATQTLADLAWRSGDLAEAARGYEEVLALHLSEDSDRLQTVKLEALERPPEVAEPLMRYLTGDLPAPEALVLLAERTHEHPDDPLLRYLYGKRLESVSPEEGVRQMQRALELGLASPAVRLEAELSLARMLLRSGQASEAERRFTAIARTATRAVVALEARDWTERAALILSQDAASTAGGTAPDGQNGKAQEAPEPAE